MTESLNEKDLKHRELQGTSGERYSWSATVSESFGFRDVSVHHEILPPGRRSSRAHAHTRREEMLYVVDGFPTAVLGEVETDLKPGDFFAFPPGSSVFHVVENRTKSEARILVISSNPPNDEVVYASDPATL